MLTEHLLLAGRYAKPIVFTSGNAPHLRVSNRRGIGLVKVNNLAETLGL